MLCVAFKSSLYISYFGANKIYLTLTFITFTYEVLFKTDKKFKTICKLNPLTPSPKISNFNEVATRSSVNTYGD